MEPNYTLWEYVLFIKRYLKTILMTVIVVLLLFVGWTIFNRTADPIPQDQPTENDVEIVFDMDEINRYLEADYKSLTQDQQATLIEYLNQDAYYFRYYVETEDSSPYTQYRIIKEILTTDEMTKTVEELSSAKFKPDSKRGIRIFFDPQTTIQTFLVGVGNPQYNQKIATIYMDILKNETLPFFENKRVTMMDTEPLKFDDTVIDQNNDVEPIETTSGTGTTIVMGIVTAIGGAILGLVIAFIANIKNKKISYLYNYGISDRQTLIKIKDTTLLEDELYVALANEKNLTSLVLFEEEFDEQLVKRLSQSLLHGNGQFVFVTDALQASQETIDKIIILTKVNVTSKEWYKKQLKLANLYEKEVKVIQIG